MTTTQKHFTTTIRYTLQQRRWLTETALKILAAQQTHIDRSTILRGVVAGLAESGIDLSKCSTEREISDEIITRLVGATKNGHARAAGRGRL